MVFRWRRNHRTKQHLRHSSCPPKSVARRRRKPNAYQTTTAIQRLEKRLLLSVSPGPVYDAPAEELLSTLHGIRTHVTDTARELFAHLQGATDWNDAGLKQAAHTISQVAEDAGSPIRQAILRHDAVDQTLSHLPAATTANRIRTAVRYATHCPPAQDQNSSAERDATGTNHLECLHELSAERGIPFASMDFAGRSFERVAAAETVSDSLLNVSAAETELRHDLAVADSAASTPAAPSTTFIVDSTVDEADADLLDGVAETASGTVTLRAAIMQANVLSGAHSIVLTAGQTYNLTLSGSDDFAAVGDLDILGDITISVAGVGTATISAGGDTGLGDRVFDVFNRLNVSDVTITGGRAAQGAGIFSAGTLSISGAQLSDNQASDLGGAIASSGILSIADTVITSNSAANDGGAIASTGTVTVSNTTFSSNSADDDGGAVANLGGTLTVNGGSWTGNSAISGGALHSSGTNPVTIQGVTFENNLTAAVDGRDGGAIYNTGDNLVIANSTFRNNTANRDGGAITNTGTALLNNTAFTGNSAANAAGALLNLDGTLTVNGGTWSGNSANFAGAFYSQGSELVSINGVTIEGNVTAAGSGTDGGAVYNIGDQLFITDTTFRNNTANRDGGAITNTGTASIGNTTFVNNTAATNAGAVLNLNGTLTIDGGSFSTNSAMAGGAVYNTGALTINDATLSDNDALSGGDGGAIYNDSAAQLEINRSTLNGNSADIGGAIYSVNSLGSVTVSNSTISGNQAYLGGGLAVDGGSAVIASSTITQNDSSHATVGGAGIISAVGTIAISNSIVSGNAATSGSDDDFLSFQTVSSAGHNLFGSVSGVTTAASDQSASDPLLGLLQDNGGLTKTHAIAAGSLAADNGERGLLTTDQRGVDATDANDDIGAFEANPGSATAPQAIEAEHYLAGDVAFEGQLTALDVDTPFASLVFTSVVNPAHGTISVGTDGAFTYDPADGFEGADRFRFRVSDGISHTEAWVRFYVVTGFDFGDAPADYSTTQGQNGPRHAAVGPFMGVLRDTELNGQPSSDADSDDSSSQSDEDGLVNQAVDLALQQGVSPEVRVVVTNADTVDATLHGWIDYNGDGSFDLSEYASTVVAAGTSAAEVTLVFPEVPVGYTQETYARFRLSTDPAAADPTGAASDGEVEDYRLTRLDFGDAPTQAQSGLDSDYPVLLADDGARHAVIPGFSLGAVIDSEADGQPSQAADLDDNTQSPDDEDGVRFHGSLTQGDSAAELEVTVVNTAGVTDPWLDAWIDFNRDGDWDDAGEQVLSQSITAGTHQLTVDVPVDAEVGDTYARFRLHSSTTATSPDGQAHFGEVEDYRITVTDPGRFREYEDNNETNTANWLPDLPVADILTATADDWLSVAGTITQIDDVDYYVFSLATAAGVFFDIDARDTGLSDVLDTVLKVFAGDGTLIDANDDGYDFETFAAPVNPTTSGHGAVSPDSSVYADLAAGTYYVSVESFNSASTGEYELRILADNTYSATVDTFSSNPGADHTLYLDFNGHLGINDDWGAFYLAEAFDFDGDTSLYSPAERLAMRNIAQVVAEDFSQFDLNVTTVHPGTFVDGESFRTVLTSSPPSLVGEPPNTRGIAFIDSYWLGDSTNQLDFIFTNAFTNDYLLEESAGTAAHGWSGRIVAAALEQGNTTSHEFGHALGLEHFRAPDNDFYTSGDVRIDGLMSTPDAFLDREIWSTGTAFDGTSQNDLAVIGLLGYRSGDQGATPVTAESLTAVDDRYTATGVIGNQAGTDVDVFRFQAAGTTIIRVDVDDYSSNLDARLRILDTNGVVVQAGAVSDPEHSFDAGLILDLPALPANTWYYAEVSHDGDYGDLGQYTLTIERTTTASHADPVLNLALPATPAAYTEGSTHFLAPTATITDADSTNFDGGRIYAAFENDHRTGDRIALNTQGTAPGEIGLQGSTITFEGVAIGTLIWNEHSAVPLQIQLNASATAAGVQALLRNLTYQSGDNPLPVTDIQIVVTDGDGGISNIETVSLDVTPVEDPPQLFDSFDFLDYQPASGAQHLFTNAVFDDPVLLVDDLNDADNRTYTSATISITDGHVSAEDLLSFDADYMTRNGLSTNWDTANGILTISGTALVEIYALALATVTYTNTNPTPDTTPREITLSMHDGTTQHTVSVQSVYLNADRHELNDVINAPVPSIIKQPDGVATGNPTPLGAVGTKTEVDLSIHRPGDVDWFYITAAATGMLQIDIEFTHSQGDLSLLLFDQNIQLVQNGTSADDNETVSHSVVAGQLYFIRVQGVNGATNDYDLIINGPAVPEVDQQAATLDEGATVTFDTSHLSASDDDTEDTTLIFTLKSPAGHGTLKKDNIALNVDQTFTQQDIIDGRISYTHNDSDTETDEFTFTVQDSDGNETAVETFSLMITPVDDNLPTIGNRMATLNEGATLILNDTQLSATDTDTENSLLIFTVKSVTDEGSLRKDTTTLAVDDSFTQQDITDGRISYTHNDSNTVSDEFTFTVQDPAGNETSVTAFTFTINAVDDDVPTVGNSLATLDEGATLTFDSSHLSATDDDTDNATLIFTVKSVAGEGTLKKDSTDLAAEDTFTQQDITDGRISYTHDDGDTISDEFTFTVQDPAGNETAVLNFTFTVTPIDDNLPAVGNKMATLNEGDSITLDSSHLSATDTDTDDSTLIFTLNSTTDEGTLKKDATALAVNDTFTQQDIADGRISYAHDGSNTTSDEFMFTVQDPAGNETVITTFSFNILPIFDESPVVTIPAAADSVNDVSYVIEGTAAADSLVRVYTDDNNNGVIDGPDIEIASQRLQGGATGFAIATPLTQNTVNNFLVTASDDVHESAPTDVPAITETDSAANLAPVLTPQSPQLPGIVEDVQMPPGVTIGELLAAGAITDGNVPASQSFQEGDISSGGIGYVADAVTIRQWSGTNTTNGNLNQNGSPQVIVGINTPWTSTSELLRGLFEFPLDDLQTLINGQGFTVESAELVLTQPSDGGRSGSAGDGDITLEAHLYDFDFNEGTSTWIDPTGTGADPVQGGTPSTLLSSAVFNVLESALTPEVTFSDSTEFRQAIDGVLTGDGTLRLLLKASDAIEAMVTPAGSSQHFARFYSESHTDNNAGTTSDVVVRPELRINLAAPKAVAVTGVNDTNGIWEYSLDGGSNWNAFDAPTERNARLLSSTDLVRFIPNADYTGDSDFTFRAWDRTAGTSGDIADTSGNGGTTPFSVALDTATITVAHGAETSVEIDGSGNLVIRDIDGGDSDDTLSVSVSADGQRIIVHDPNHGLQAGNGAVSDGVHTVEVAISGITGPDGIIFDLLDGDDTVNVLSLPAGFDGSVSIMGQAGTDTVTFSGDISLAANRSLNVTADVIHVSSLVQTTGSGVVALTADRSIALSSGAEISTVEGGVTLTANTSQAVSGDFHGISIDDASVITTGAGMITLTGTGGDTLENHGILIQNGSIISASGAGGIDLTGHGRSGAASDGIRVLDSGTEIRSHFGAIQLTGDTAADEGIVIANGSAVKSLGTGAGAATITIHGTSGPGRPGDDSNGLTIGNAAIVTSVDGDIQIDGVGTTGLRGFRFFNGSSITSTGTTASGANITITGTGGSDSAAAFSGVDVTAVKGDITVVGTAGLNGVYGVDLYNGARIEVTDGKLDVTGTGGDGGDGTQRAGVNLSDASASSFGILGSAGPGEIMVTSMAGAIQSRGSSIIGGPAATGDITLVASEFKLNETSVQTTGTVYLQSLTDTESVTLDSADIDAAVTVDGATINSAPGTVITAPSVTFAGTLAPGSSPGLITVDGDAVLAAGETFEVEIDGTEPGDGAGKHDQLSATGSVVIEAGVELLITALNSFTPVAGQEFTIISRTGGSGTFNGLAEGATVSTDFLGSGLTATISYAGGASNQDVVVTVQQVAATIAGRHVFYNNSYYDDPTLPRTGEPEINANDDAAIATDKTALMPGVAASFINYTSYSRGLNGIMIDISGAPGPVTLADFALRVGNTSNPDTWAAAPAPTGFAVRPAAGNSGSDRVTMTWDDIAINNQWLQVTVLANENTGLSSPDVHYWGNQIGETGNNATTSVDGGDVGIVVNNPSGFGSVDITNPYDLNKTGFVDGGDIGIVVNNPTGFTSLLLFTPPEPPLSPTAVDPLPVEPASEDESSAEALEPTTDTTSETQITGNTVTTAETSAPARSAESASILSTVSPEPDRTRDDSFRAPNAQASLEHSVAVALTDSLHDVTPADSIDVQDESEINSVTYSPAAHKSPGPVDPSTDSDESFLHQLRNRWSPKFELPTKSAHNAKHLPALIRQIGLTAFASLRSQWRALRKRPEQETETRASVDEDQPKRDDKYSTSETWAGHTQWPAVGALHGQLLERLGTVDFTDHEKDRMSLNIRRFLTGKHSRQAWDPHHESDPEQSDT